MEKEKKEIGIEKLIELLNEWQEKELGKAGAKYLMFDGINKVFRLNNGCSLCQELVLSHRFCFIKWLVENDKIDRDKKEIEKSDYDITFTGALTMDKKSDLDIMVDTLLMLLSISDTPIKFLVSILR